MGSASVSIKILSSYNGAGVQQSLNSLEKLQAQAAVASGGMAQSAVTAGNSWLETGATLQNAGYKLEQSGKKWLGVTAVMTTVGAASVAAAVTMDDALTGVRKTVDGTEQEYQQLKESAIEFSKTNVTSAAQIMDLQALGAQLGFSKDELMEFAEVASGLDIATDMDAETAATEMAQFANITKMAHGEVSNYGSTIVNLGNNLATTESKVSAMGQRVAAAGNQVKMTVPEILGWSAAMASVGVEAEAGGTAFSTTIATIDASVAAGSMSLEEYARATNQTTEEAKKDWEESASACETFAAIVGMSAGEFAAAWKESASDTMVALLQGVDSAENMTVALEGMGVTGIRQTDVLKRLAGNTELVEKAVGLANEGWEENTALSTEVANKNESVSAKFAMLQNKVTAVAEDIGTPLCNALLDVIDAAQPVIDVVENVSTGFSNLDEGVQRNIVTIAAGVAAVGPVLTVGGKYLQLAGSVTSAIGTRIRKTGDFIGILKTENTSVLERTANEGTWIQKLGVSMNKTARATQTTKARQEAEEKAAAQSKKLSDQTQKTGDSSDKLKTSTSKATDSMGKLADKEKATATQTDKLKTSTDKSATSQGKLSDESKKASTNVKASSDAAKTGATNTKALGTAADAAAAGEKASATGATANATAIKGQTIAAQASTVALTALKTVAAACIPMAIVAVVGFFASKLTEAADHSAKLTSATTGLTDAIGLSTDGTTAQADALAGLSASSTNATEAVSTMLENQAQLASTIKETNTTANAQAGQLRAAYATIQEYANQSDLSTDAQGRLRAAVETVNSMTDAQIEVVDIANGKLKDQNGAIEDVAGSLDQYVQKKLEQIQIDAQQENLTALYKQQAEDIQAVAAATSAYNTRMEEMISYQVEHNGLTREQAEELANAQMALTDEGKALDDAKAALDSCNQAISNTEASLGALSASSQTSTTSVRDMAMASAEVASAVQGVGGSLDDFANDIADAGISVSDFNSLSQEQLIELVGSWDGTVDSISGKLGEMVENNRSDGQAAAQALANGIDAGRIDVESASSALKSAASGDWASTLKVMEEHGINVPGSVADGITSNTGMATRSSTMMLSALALTLTGGDCKAAAELLGHDIDQGLADAIRSNNTSVLESMGLTSQEVIDKAKETFDSHSPSRVFEDIGRDNDEGLKNGIDGGKDGLISAMEALGQSVVDALNDVPGQLNSVGSDGSNKLASGLPANASKVSGNARSLGSFTKSGVSDVPNALSTTGTNASSKFASGIASSNGTVSSNARNLSTTAKSGVSSLPGEMGTTGTNASSRFASGIGSGRRATSSSAGSLATAARGMKDVGDTHSYGSHLAQNFANGISAGLGWVRTAATNIANAAKSVLGFSVPESGPYSGKEKGGYTSGLHLAQNFAEGMDAGGSYVSDAAMRLANQGELHGKWDGSASYGVNKGPGQYASRTVVNNYYTIGDVTVDASSLSEFMTVEQLFTTLKRAKEGC